LWSLASQIITIQRACLDSALVGDLMSIKENSFFLNKFFCDITGNERILRLVYPAGGEDDVDVGA
jgi:hypothetical protein